MKEGNDVNTNMPSLLNNQFAYYDVIESIVTALDAKDTYTANHSRRVGGMADLLCDYLGEKDSVKATVHIASHIHDIGKIGIPDHILNKPGKLTEEEWECMKRHTSIGANILKKSEALKSLSDVVLYHHERWDGKGYYGLEKENIPLEARIIAVCDSIDAMTSKRAYRETLSIEYCKNEIQSNIGRMYDPRVASVAVKHFEHLLSLKVVS